MDIRVLSRNDAESYLPGEDAICISINERGLSPADLPTNRYRDVLRLIFDDIDGEHGGGMIPFDASHAKRILAFVREYRDAGELIVHCTFGVSRSPGVALGILDALGIEAQPFAAHYPSHNRLVRTTLRRVGQTDRLGMTAEPTPEDR